MKNHFFSWLTAVPVLLLVPYIAAGALNGLDTALMNRRADVEMCLPAMIATEITEDNELETVKAQAVIARSNLYRRLGSNENFFDILKEIQETIKNDYSLFFVPPGIYEKAVTQTKGKVLSYEGELKLVPYHALSSGATREGQEVLHDREYTYLKSVDSSADKNSPDYLGSSYIKEQQMPSELTIEKRDSAGYVTELAADGSIIEGEAFRQGMGLDSADFTVQKIGEEYRFLCKGKGHGLGFSQYGGNELAKAGSTFSEILETYFPEMEIKNINSVLYEKP